LLRSVETDGKSVFRILVHMTGEDRPAVAEMTVDWRV
jgi:hypothetical protein